MLPFIIAGTTAVGLFSAILIDDFKKFEEERKNINTAQIISEQNKTVGNMINIENSTSGNKINESLSNSQLLTNKPVSYKVVNFEGGEREKEIANRYSEAVRRILKNSPNANITCSLLAGTNLITVQECNLVHNKSYNFYHKTSEGNLSYRIDDSKIRNYALQIEANKYNLSKEDIEVDNKIMLDRRYLQSNNKFLTTKKTNEIQNSFTRIKNHINTKNYLLASAELYAFKKNNYQNIPLISSLFINLFEEVEILTKNAQRGTDEYDMRIKIQTEFAKLTKVSNISDMLNLSNSINAKNFVNSISTNYTTIEQYERSLSSNTELPSKNEYMAYLRLLSN